MKKRILAIALVCLMLVSMLPTVAFAEEASVCPGVGVKHTKDNCDYEQVGEPVPPLCGEYGYTLYQCKECGIKFVADFVAPAEGQNHVWKVTAEAVAATCTTTGLTQKDTCENCGLTRGGETIAALGHDYVFVSQTGDCLTGGVKTEKCSRCDDVKETPIAGTGEGHTWATVPTIITEPTCETEGVAEYKCTVCDATKRVEIWATHEHTLTAHAAVAATCTTAGNVAYWTCDVCGGYFADANANTSTTAEAVVIPALGHTGYDDATSTNKVTVDPTCTEDGKKTWNCGRCGEALETTLPATGHSYDDEPSIIPATCTAYGFKVYACTVCGDTNKIVRIDPLGHTTYDEKKDGAYVSTNRVTIDATCEVDGKKTWNCGRCGVAQEKTLTKTGHNVKTHTVAATCVATGYTFTYCTNDNCDKALTGTYNDGTNTYDVRVNGENVHFLAFGEILAINPNGHNMSWTVVNEASCTVPGNRVGYCTLCSLKDVIEVIPVKPHTEVEIPAVAATCTATGLTAGKVCSVCRTVTLAQQETEALGHDMVAGTPVPATCQRDGYTLYTCSRCGATEQRDFVELVEPANWYNTLDEAEVVHTFTTSPTVFREGSCTVIGLYQYTCDDCGRNILVRIGGTGTHNWVTIQAEVPATCTGNGMKEKFECSKCGETKGGEVIPATGHTEVTDAAVAPTCTGTGLTEGKHCSKCNTVLVAQQVVPATGHTVVIDAAVAATCTTEGKTEGKHCSVCNTVLVAPTTIPALGHNMIIVDQRNADCVNFGYIHWACDRCKSEETKDFTLEYINNYKVALGHRPTDVPAVAPDCTHTGLTAGKKCSVCNTVLVAQEVVPATGHKNAAGETLVDSCTNTATDRVCAACGDTVGTTHDNLIEVHVAATCKDYGYDLQYCDACGYQHVYNVDNTYLADHTPGAWVIDVQPTITTKGHKYQKCTVCGIKLAESDIDPLTGLVFNMETANAVKGDKYSDSSLVAVTVTITGNEKGVDVWGMTFDVYYDEVFEFVRAESASASFEKVEANDNDGYVSVIANTANDMNGTTNASITAKEEVIVLYFRVTMGDEDYEAQNAGFSFDNIDAIKNDNTSITTEDNSAEIEILKFMDINEDGFVSIADARLVAEMITTSTDYNVVVDVNKDGKVDVVDFMIIREYLISAKTYEDVTALGVDA